VANTFEAEGRLFIGGNAMVRLEAPHLRLLVRALVVYEGVQAERLDKADEPSGHREKRRAALQRARAILRLLHKSGVPLPGRYTLAPAGELPTEAT
jgi:hypothetical protein